MGRMYTASVVGVAATAAQDFFAFTAAADMCVIVHSVRISQTTEFGDAAAEMLDVSLTRYATIGSIGSTPVARPHNVGDVASSLTAIHANDTTQGATPTVLLADSFNVQAGWLYVPTPEERMVVSPSGVFAVEVSAPADSVTFSGSITFEEIGG